MRKAASLVFLALALPVAASPIAAAGEPSQAKPAATRQLPAALRALEPTPHQIVSEHEAAAVRGQWLLTLDLPLIAARIHGRGKFDLNLLTVSSGVLAGRPVMVHITVGDRNMVIRAPRPMAGIR